MTYSKSLVATAVLLGQAGSAPAELIVNGSFESSSGTTINNWTVTPTATSVSAADFALATGVAPYGPRFVAFNTGLNLPGGSVTQDFAALTAGQEYLVSFAYGTLGTTGTQILEVTINTTSVPIPAQTFTDSTPTNDLGSAFQTANFTFTSAGFDSGITFADLSVGVLDSSDLILDNVSIVPIPEPTMVATLTLAGVLLRRRSKIGSPD